MEFFKAIIHTVWKCSEVNNKDRDDPVSGNKVILLKAFYSVLVMDYSIEKNNANEENNEATHKQTLFF